MEITLHPKSDIATGDLLRVEEIYGGRLDMSTLRYERIAKLIKLPDHTDLIRACKKLLIYRDVNPLNFQLEKADDFIDIIRDILTEMELSGYTYEG